MTMDLSLMTGDGKLMDELQTCYSDFNKSNNPKITKNAYALLSAAEKRKLNQNMSTNERTATASSAAVSHPSVAGLSILITVYTDKLNL